MAIDYCAISFNFPEFLQFIPKSAELHILVLSAEKIEYFFYLLFLTIHDKKKLISLKQTFQF